MKKLFAIIVSLAMLSVLVPGTAAVTATAFYDVPSGPNSAGVGLTTRPCAQEWREWEGGLIGGDDDPTDPAAGEALTVATETGCGAVDPENDGAVRIGVFGAAIEQPEDLFTNFVVSVEDDNFDSTFFSFCVFTGADNICDSAEDIRASGCGSVTLDTGGILSGGPENGLSAFVYASHVDQDTLEVCLGSSGFLSAVMS